MRQAQINVRTRACSRTSIARTKQAALTHNVRGKELRPIYMTIASVSGMTIVRRINDVIVLVFRVFFLKSCLHVYSFGGECR